MSKFENSVVSYRKNVFVNDFNVPRKVTKKQGENLPLASLYRISRYASPTKACRDENGIAQITNHSLSTLHCTVGTK
jgi:hypothetical protein